MCNCCGYAGQLAALLALLLPAHAALATEFHVSVNGSDAHDGSPSRPFKTIGAAARAAQPGDTITVHAGTYRERVTPPRGGDSGARRIVYQAAPGENVVIKGSEVVRNWKRFQGAVWKATLPNSFFGSYNPYKDRIVGDWFSDRGRPHHTGEVYLNGKSLFESHLLERVLNPLPFAGARDAEGSTYTWFAEADDNHTYIYANFHDRDPNQELVEINVRDSCFYPDQPGRNYITVRGFRMMHAATQWAAPTAEQIGLIGTHWSKGWIIENNVISDSKCSGITLGKDRKTGHNVWISDPRKDGATHYNETIVRALETAGWSRENIGSHIVRGNTIFNCEQTGICGSLGAIFSTIENNYIHHIWTKRQFSGAEIAGIKLHGAIDVVIRNNRIHNAGRGLWMDWMAQGTRISRNLLYDNSTDDLFVEVDHGPFLVDNNLFLSSLSLNDMSQGGAYVHNLMTGRIITRPEPRRSTPYHKAHSTALAGLTSIAGGDDRFYNNIFIGSGASPAGAEADANPLRFGGYGLWVYNHREYPLYAGGNVYLKGARPYVKEDGSLDLRETDAKAAVVEDGGNVFLLVSLAGMQKASTRLVNTGLLGKAKITGLPYENADGSPAVIDTDYTGRKRNTAAPSPGPFENPGQGSLKLKVW
ncbi:MAG: right-handed parallel beta-helix repeat-containing protein [Bryobacteraceae bacterium]